jgi:Fe-S-cluster-containing hydrogenase component 2
MAETLRTKLTLTRVRTGVQIITLFLTVWGASVLGHYAADKISTALPALSCAYDQQHGAYCALIPLEHQMHHRIGEALDKAQQITLQVILPMLVTLATFAAFFLVAGKAFCAWVCPLGTLQEWLNRVGRRLGLVQNAADAKTATRLRPVKWVIFLGLVFIVPLLSGMNVVPHNLGNPFCDMCPSRVATTLLGGQAEEFAVPEVFGIKFLLGGLANTIFGFTLVGALALRQPFCRICPMLAMNAVFRHASLTRLVKVRHDKCEKCGICTKACPMDIPEIHHESGRKAFNEDCTLCGRCAEFCPDDGIIQVKFGPWAVFSSSRDYYKRRLKAETPEGDPKPLKFMPKPRPAGDAP